MLRQPVMVARLLHAFAQVFNGSRSTRTEEQVLATSALVQEWKRMQGDEGAEEQAAQPCDTSKPIEGDCPICYDEMHPGGSTAEVSCRTLSVSVATRRPSWQFCL